MRGVLDLVRGYGRLHSHPQPGATVSCSAIFTGYCILGREKISDEADLDQDVKYDRSQGEIITLRRKSIRVP